MQNLENLAEYQARMRVKEKANNIAHIVGLTVAIPFGAAITYACAKESNDPYAGLALGILLSPLYSAFAYALAGIVAYGISYPILNRKISQALIII